ncbi:MAG TPA: RNA polymerase sigma-70 factor [Puia sp.]
MSDTPPYDKELLEQVAQGNETAFKVIFDRHWDRLYNYMMALTKSPEVAEEIAADVFLKLWTGRELLPGIHNLEAFLLRVAHNKAMDFFAVTARNAKYQKIIFEAIRQPEVHGADYQILDKEAQVLLSEILSGLSLRRRLVFTLHRIEGLSHEEIAQRLNLSHQTVKNTMADAQRSLRNLLKKKFPDGLFFFLMFLLWAL